MARTNGSGVRVGVGGVRLLAPPDALAEAPKAPAKSAPEVRRQWVERQATSYALASRLSVQPVATPGGAEGAASRWLDRHLSRRSDGGFLEGLGVFRLTSLAGAESITDPFRENHWVRAAIRAIARAISAVPLELYESEDPDARVVESNEHPLRKLLARPNRRLTGRQLHARDVLHLALDGDSFWFLADAQGKPVQATDLGFALPAQIIQVRGAWAQPDLDAQGWPRAWRYSRAQSRDYGSIWPDEAVVQFAEYDPSNPVRGFGDVESLHRALAMQWQAERYQAGVLGNSGEPGGLLIFKESLGAPELARAQDEADEEFGNPDNAGRTKVISGDAKYERLGLTPKDLEYGGLLSWIRDTILAVLGVPPPVLGIYDDASDNDVQTAHAVFWEGGNGVLARLEELEDVIRERFVRRLREPSLNRLDLRFDRSKIAALKRDHLARMKAAQELAAARVGVSFADAMALAEVEADAPPGSEIATAPLGLTTWDKVGEEQPVPEPVPAALAPAGDDEDEDDETARALHGTPGGLIAQALGARYDAHASSTRTPETCRLIQAAQYRAITELADAHLKGKVKGWIERKERAQLKKIRDFANGERMLVEPTQERSTTKLGGEWNEDDVAFLNLARARWEKELRELTRPALTRIFLDAAAEEWAALGEAGTLITANNPLVVAAMQRQTVMLAQDVTGTLAEKIRKSILRALAEGADGTRASLREAIRQALPEVTGNVAKAFGNKDRRAQAIARTETGNSRHTARFEQMRESGVRWKEWITAADSEVRVEHQVLDREMVPIDQPFSNGLQFPHQRVAGVDAVQSVNCRCNFVAAFTGPNP